ncbi:MAG: diacylglycerol/polyprenol kinase family protein [Promethearchaeota archaeon]
MFGIANAIIGIILLLIALVFLKTARNFDNKEAFYSTLITSIAIIIVGIYFLVRGLLVVLENPYNPSAAVYLPLTPPFPNTILLFIPISIYFFGLYAIKESIQKKYITKEAQIEVIHKGSIAPIDLEIARKLFHTVIDALLICYLFIGDFVSEAVFSSATSMGTTHGFTPFFFIVHAFLWMKKPYILPNAGQMVTVFAIFLVFILVSFSDLIRIYKFRYYPIKVVSNIYRDKERYYFGPHIYLAAGGLFATVFFPPKIAMATIAIAALGDAFATIIGIGFGKHKLHGGKSRKTYEGCLGGFIAGFCFALLSYIILLPKYPDGNLIEGIIVSLTGALILFLIDFYSPPIKASDNILNPVLCSISMFIISFFI